MHEGPLLPSIFGCPHGLDKLPHYLECPMISMILGEILGCEISPFMKDRLNLSSPSKHNAAVITCTYNMYHTVKLGHRQVVDNAIQTGCFAASWQIATATASEYALQYKHLFETAHGGRSTDEASD